MSKSTEIATAPKLGINLPEPAVARGIEPHVWATLTGSIYRGAPKEMILAVWDYCASRKLDPIKKPVHIVSVYDRDANGMVATIWEGIASLRTTAFRTGEYAGRDAAEWGEAKTETWKGAKGEPVTVSYPEWCQITLYRTVGGQKCAFPGPRVFWMETYASTRGGAPNAMWQKRPQGQLEKCAEAAALRAAFPDELGGLYSAEENDGSGFDGVTLESDTPASAEPEEKKTSASLDDFGGKFEDAPEAEEKPKPKKKSEPEPLDIDSETGEIIEADDPVPDIGVREGEPADADLY